jgi:hypothetical protein
MSHFFKNAESLLRNQNYLNCKHFALEMLNNFKKRDCDKETHLFNVHKNVNISTENSFAAVVQPILPNACKQKTSSQDLQTSPSQISLQALDRSSGLLFSKYLKETTIYYTYPDCPYNSTQFDITNFSHYLIYHQIESVAIWKVPLFEWLPIDFGMFYHAYLVIETNNTLNGELQYWSFEKNTKFLILQQTPQWTKRNVVNNLFGKPRLKGTYWKPTLLSEGFFNDASYPPAPSLSKFYFSAEMRLHNHKYDLMFLNCQHFTMEMFNLFKTTKKKWDSVSEWPTSTFTRVLSHSLDR